MMLSTEPKTKSVKALKKWQEEGALNLQELVESNKIKFERNLEIKQVVYRGNTYDG